MTQTPESPESVAVRRFRAHLLAAVLAASLLPAAAVHAQLSHNHGDPPPSCNVPFMIQPNGSYTSPMPPFCASPSSAAVTIDEAKVVDEGLGENRRRLIISASGGSVTVNGQTRTATHLVISNNRLACHQWFTDDPLVECWADFENLNPNGSGSGGDQVGLCQDGSCKVVFRPRFPARHWTRVSVVGYASNGTLLAQADAIVYVEPAGLPPTAAIRATQSPANPFTWSFDGSNSLAQESGRTITGWAWDFGDGATATGAMVEHTYGAAGLYTVTLTVTDSAGAKGSTTYLVNASPLVVSLAAGVTNGKIFSVELTVRNADTAPMTDVAFGDPAGIVPNTIVGDPSTAGEVRAIAGPTPDLPTSLAPGESATTTVTFAVEKQGGVDLDAEVTATDSDDDPQSGSAHAIVQIGRRPITPTEKERLLSDALTDGSQTAGALLNALHTRIGLIIAWASGPNGGGPVPPWLTVPITGTVVVPPGVTLEDPPWLNTTAGRAFGFDDRAFSLVPDDTSDALLPFLKFADKFLFAGGKVVDQSGNAAIGGLQYAWEFYGQLASGNQSFRAEASRQFSGIVSDAGDGVGAAVTLLGAILQYANDDPDDVGKYERSPALQQFSQQSGAIIDAGLTATYQKIADLVYLAKNDPVAASGELGDTLGTLFTTLGRDIALTEFGMGGVTRLGGAIEKALPFARTGRAVDGGLAAADPATAALTASVDGTGEVIVRQSLESLGEGAILTPQQLETLGGFYAKDAERVQKIVNDINMKYGVNIEIQCRPGNPESLQFFLDGTGVPKPEWVKPKNTEWMDLVLGAPKDSVGKATVFRPIRPTEATLRRYTPAQRQTILDRYDTQVKIFDDATKPGGKFHKLIADSKNPEGATVTIGHGTGTRDVTGLKYSLREVGEPGQEAFLVIDEAAGGKFVLSDADYQAVFDAATMQHLPAGIRGKIELEVMNRLNKETVSFGGHGWTHSGFDFSSKYSESFLKFLIESSSPASARRTLDWFVGRGDLPQWMHKIYTDLALELGHPPTNAELVAKLLDTFRPGTFVIKFNGTDIRTGYGAGIR